MRDKTWGERLEDAVDTAANAVGLLSLIAVVLTAVWAVTYCWVNRITVRDIGHTIISFVDDGKGDETGFVQAMRSVGYNEDANAALEAGHKMCSRLRSDGSTPTDIANWMESNRPAGIDAAIWRKMTFDLVTNAQVYLCPDTLHNTGTPTPTTVTPAPTAPPAPTTMVAPTAPPAPTTMVATTAPPAPTTMVATTAPGSFQYVPLWPFASQQEADRWLREDAPRGISPWHADPKTSALNFTRNYLGFSEIDRITHVEEQGEEAWVSVGYTLPNGEHATAATIHLVRYGTGPKAPWAVVGTEDTKLTVTAPAYGSSVGPVVYAGGAITGVDEAVHVQVRQSTQKRVLGEFCCVQTGGNPGSWSAQVRLNGPQPGALTMVVWTGGHVARVEQFAITGLRVG